MSEREMHGPPELPDLYGKRRELAKIQVLDTEIGFLQEVISMEGRQPASTACKEVVDFVTCNADPLIPISKTKKNRRSRCFWKWLCGLSCFIVSCICCSSNTEKPQCCEVSSCWKRKCSDSKCSSMFNCSSCLTSSSSTTGHRSCPEVNMCSCYNKTRCYSCCFCY